MQAAFQRPQQQRVRLFACLLKLYGHLWRGLGLRQHDFIKCWVGDSKLYVLCAVVQYQFGCTAFVLNGLHALSEGLKTGCRYGLKQLGFVLEVRIGRHVAYAYLAGDGPQRQSFNAAII